MRRTDWLTKVLLAGILLLLALNIVQTPVTPAKADDQVIVTPGANLLNLGNGLVLVQQDYELFLVGIRKTYDMPVDDHTIQLLSSKALEK